MFKPELVTLVSKKKIRSGRHLFPSKKKRERETPKQHALTVQVGARRGQAAEGPEEAEHEGGGQDRRGAQARLQDHGRVQGEVQEGQQRAAIHSVQNANCILPLLAWTC